MSLFSKIKDLGTSTAVLTRLYGKSWDLLESDDRISYIFNTVKDAHFVINGASTNVRYDFIPSSKTLIIYFNDKGGTSYHLKFVNEGTLILKSEDNGIDLCFCNRSSKSAPKDKSEAYKFYFSKHIEYVKLKYDELKGFSTMRDQVDKVVESLDRDDLIHLVDTLRKFLPGFDKEYIDYLGYYSKKNDPAFNENEVYKKLKRYFVQTMQSKTLDYYIDTTRDNIKYYRLV